MLYDKAGDLAEARARLTALRGRGHALHGGVVAARARRRSSGATTETARLCDARLLRRLPGRLSGARAARRCWRSVGGYQLEGEGAQLFERDRGRLFRHPRPAAARRCWRFLRDAERAADDEAADLRRRRVVAGVAGAPVAHSLSPLIHNAWLEAAGHRRGLRRLRAGARTASRRSSRGCAAAWCAASTSPCRSRKRRWRWPIDASARPGAPARPTC